MASLGRLEGLADADAVADVGVDGLLAEVVLLVLLVVVAAVAFVVASAFASSSSAGAVS